MSTLRTLIDAVRQQALSMPQRIYETSAARHPPLAAHLGVGAAWKALLDDREETYPARDALTRAIVIEHRESRHSLWGSVLLVAFYPMLSRLRHRLISDAVPRDELDQLVITSFLIALAELPAYAEVDRLAMRLRQRTERAVFASLRRERGHQHADVDPDELGGQSETATRAPSEPVDEARLDLALLLERASEQGVVPRGLDVLDATVLGSERLRAYVERTTPGDPKERERIYQRLKRQRTRALQRLRTLLGSPERPSAAS